MIGEGQLHGEDDAVALRPYQSSLRCNTPHSEVYILNRLAFFNMFKSSTACWTQTLSLTQLKETKYSTRCKFYLYINKLVMEKSKNTKPKKNGTRKENKICIEDLKQYEEIEDK